jgi:hypothetical protein
LLLAQYNNEITVDARIVGVGEIKKAYEGRTQPLMAVGFGALMILIGMVAFTVYEVPKSTQQQPEVDVHKIITRLPYIVPLIIGYLLVLYGQIKMLRTRRSFKKYLNQPDTHN